VTLLKLASRRTFASLRRHYNYRLYFAGQLTSVCGTWMQNIALAWLVVQLAPTNKGLALAMFSICRFGPFMLIGLFAGVVTDRFDNRRVVIATQSVQMLFAAVLAVIELTGHSSLMEVDVIAFLTGIAIVFDTPSRQSLTFQMVGRDELPNAIALNSSLFNTARIFGPALAGVVIATQSVQMFFSAVLAVITLVGHVQLWEVYAIAALSGIALVFDAPSRQNLTFRMVGRDELPNAIALNSSLFNTARIFGPALAGVLIAAFGSGWCFAINTLSFVAVLAGLLAMRVSELYPLVDRGRPTIWRGTREGFRYARSNRTVLVILAMMAVFSSICFNFNIILPLLAKDTLDAGPRTFGIISACFGAGALVGALSAAAMASARWRTMFLGATGFGIIELMIAPAHSVLLVGPLLFVCGVFFTSYSATSNTSIQLASPDYIRGRVLGLYYYAWNGLAPLGALIVGLLCDRGGTELAFFVGGSSALVMAVLGATAVRRPPRAAAKRLQAEPPTEQLAA
jgi:MFS family permease